MAEDHLTCTLVPVQVAPTLHEAAEHIAVNESERTSHTVDVQSTDHRKQNKVEEKKKALNI